jgi:hypothetical protein
LRAAGTELFPVAENRFMSARGTVLEFDDMPSAEGRPAVTLNPESEPVRMEPVPPFAPMEAQSGEYVGRYRSDEAEATYRVFLEEGELTIENRWGNGRRLAPLYPDAFQAGGNTIIFRRDASGQITGLTLSQGRVWDLRFRRLEGDAGAGSQDRER